MTIATPSPLLTELASLLARGYMRLTQKSRDVAVFPPRIPQKELDVLAEESPHEVEKPRPRRAS